MSNLISLTPEWLRRALGLTEPNLPIKLGTDDIMPVLDVLQGGWGRATWSHEQVTQPASTAQTSYDLVAVSTAANPLTRIILAMDIFHSGGGAPLTIEFLYREPVENLSTRRFAVASIVGSRVPVPLDTDFIRVPPGLSFQVRVPATGIGESVAVSAIVGTLAGGVRP